MVPSLLSEEYQAAWQLSHDEKADPSHRQIADGALARIQEQMTEVPSNVTLDWRRGFIDPSLPLRIAPLGAS